MGIGNDSEMKTYEYVHGTVDAYIQRCTLSLSTYKPSSRAQTHALGVGEQGRAGCFCSLSLRCPCVVESEILCVYYITV